MTARAFEGLQTPFVKITFHLDIITNDEQNLPTFKANIIIGHRRGMGVVNVSGQCGKENVGMV